MNTSESVRERIVEHVTKRVSALQRDYLGESRRPTQQAAATRMLAVLRRGVGTRPGSMIELDAIALEGLYEVPPRSDEPTHAELAVVAAITLYAVHQQSVRTAHMHRQGFSFGRSARLLGRRTHSEDAVRRRFNAFATASSWDERLHHARGLVTQLRGATVPLDYGRLARDLYDLRFADSVDRVRLAWGRDFYRIRDPEDEDATRADETTPPNSDSPAREEPAS